MKKDVVSGSMRTEDNEFMKQEALTIEQKAAIEQRPASGKLVFAGDALLIVFAATACLGLYHFWQHPLSALVQCLVFVVAGAVHVSLVRKKLPLVTVTAEWVYTVVMAVLAAGLLRSAELLGTVLPMRLVASCAAAYLLPFALSEIWQARVQLAYQNARVWYPSKEWLIQYPSFYFNNTPVQFRIVAGKGGPKESVVFRASKELSLGKIFFDLVQNKLRKNGKEIALTDAGRTPFHWMFFTTDGFLFSRALDPEKTIDENSLKENAVIYAQKIYEEDLALLSNYKRENN